MHIQHVCAGVTSSHDVLHVLPISDSHWVQALVAISLVHLVELDLAFLKNICLMVDCTCHMFENGHANLSRAVRTCKYLHDADTNSRDSPYIVRQTN